MTVGDAMGMAVKGLKPETVKQCFGTMDDFKDVRSFVGREIKHYRMKGLYGAQTQTALAVCDCMLDSRKAEVAEISDLFSQLTAAGPEGYFGVFRGEESGFRQTVESFAERKLLIPAEQKYTGCGYPSLAVPIALYHQENSSELMAQCMETYALMTRDPLEVMGSALIGYLVTEFLALEPETQGEGVPEKRAQLFLQNAAKACETAEAVFKERFPELWAEFGEDYNQGLKQTFQGMAERFNLEEGPLFTWICDNASRYGKVKIMHPTQGHVLTLLPLALYLVLKGGNDFQSILTRALNMGKEAPKLGTLAGAFAGALYGFESIPQLWKTGLVNAKEIRARGEALSLQRQAKGLKDLHDMEQGLTGKEAEERKRYLPKTAQKPAKKAAPVLDLWDDEQDAPRIPRKEDAGKWREFERDKSRTKRDRRRNLKSDFDN